MGGNHNKEHWPTENFLTHGEVLFTNVLATSIKKNNKAFFPILDFYQNTVLQNQTFI